MGLFFQVVDFYKSEKVFLGKEQGMYFGVIFSAKRLK